MTPQGEGEARRPSDRWIYAASLTGISLGFGLMVFGSTPEVIAAGLLVSSAVAAALAASLGAHRVTDVAARRFTLAVLFALAMVAPAIFLTQQRSPVEVALGSIEPRPGSPMTLNGLEPRGAGTVGKTAPISAALGSLEVAVEPPGVSKMKAPAGVLVALPVEPEDCPELEARLEGSCDRLESPRHLGEPLTIESLNPNRSLIAEIDPEVRSLELSESTPRSQRNVPVEWALAGGGGRIELEVRCPRGTRVIIARLPSRALTHCGAREARFYIPLAPLPGSGLSLFLSELSEFQAHLGAKRVQADIETGHLEISDESRDLPQAPVRIDFGALPGDSVDLDIRQSVEGGQNQVSLESDRAERVEISDDDERRSWLQQNTTFVYFVLGLIAAALIPALLEFVLRRMGK